MGNVPNTIALWHIVQMWGVYKWFNEMQQLYELVEAYLHESFVHMYVLGLIYVSIPSNN